MQKQIRDIAKKIPGARAVYSAYLAVEGTFRKVRFSIEGGTRYRHKYVNTILAEALGRSDQRSDISDHLGTIFYTAIDAAPRLIVELGTRGGDSTRALLAAAAVTQSTLLSIDIEDCGQISVPFRERWHFVKADDVEFGRTGFRNWCLGHSIEPVIDVLFIDTTHEYEHTREEIEVWGAFLSREGIMIFHDTNTGTGVFARADGSIGFGWDNDRGVMKAVEEFVGRQYDENSFFCDVTDIYSLIHFPNCNGLTIVKKRKKSA